VRRLVGGEKAGQEEKTKERMRTHNEGVTNMLGKKKKKRTKKEKKE